MPPKSSRARPDLRHERALGGVVAGVDEVGRAPLAGPVLAAAVILPPQADADPALAGIDDSKLLGIRARERLAAAIRQVAPVGLGAASVAEIDRLNIHRATLLAMSRAVAALRRAAGAAGRLDGLLVDGRHAPAVGCRTVPLVGGDRRSLTIAAASIVAKVARDRMMQALDRRHPGYGWAVNAGYPTEDHLWGLLRQGPCCHHRQSFGPVRALLTHPGLGLRFGPVPDPAAGPRPPRLRLCALRRNLYAIADAQGRHLGVLRQGRGRGGWTIGAVGYGSDGLAEDGAGPLAPVHGLAVALPEAAAVAALLAAAEGAVV